MNRRKIPVPMASRSPHLRICCKARKIQKLRVFDLTVRTASRVAYWGVSVLYLRDHAAARYQRLSSI